MKFVDTRTFNVRTLKFRVSKNFNILQNKKKKQIFAIVLFKMASKLGKFQRNFLFLRVRCHHYEIFAETRSKQDDGCELFPAEFCGVTLSRYGHAHEGTND